MSKGHLNCSLVLWHTITAFPAKAKWSQCMGTGSLSHTSGAVPWQGRIFLWLVALLSWVNSKCERDGREVRLAHSTSWSLPILPAHGQPAPFLRALQPADATSFTEAHADHHDEMRGVFRSMRGASCATSKSQLLDSFSGMICLACVLNSQLWVHLLC